MEKPMLFCFALIAFIELNVTVAFLLIRMTNLLITVGGWGISRNGGDPSNST